jgi:hypothetical protein
MLKARLGLLLAAGISTIVFVNSAYAEVFSHRIRGLEITTKQQQAQIAQLKKELEGLKKGTQGNNDLASEFDKAGKAMVPQHQQPKAPYSFP